MGTSFALIAKSLIASGLYHFKLLDKKIASTHPIVLGYHRVLRKNAYSQYLQSGMYVTPQTFEKHLQFLAQKFTVVSLHSWIDAVNSKKKFDKPLCAITFDDGWEDTYTHAYPLLKKFNLPATVFLATDYINSSKEFWTDTLTDLLKTPFKKLKDQPLQNETVTSVLHTIMGLRKNFSQRLETAISLLKPLSENDKVSVIEALECCSLNTSVKQLRPFFLTTKQITTMKDSGLITFGSHTHTHPILTTLSSYEAAIELQTSKDYLLQNNLCTHEFIPFCYPNGNFSEILIKSVEQHGYSAAFVTTKGKATLPEKMYSIPRTLVHNDISYTTPLFAAKILDIF